MAVSFSRNLDRLGMMASLACALHCALMPLVVSALPLLLQDERIEWLLVGTAAGLGVGSLTRGYRRHRKREPLIVLATGLALLVCGRLIEERVETSFGVVLVVSGGLSVALSHFLNHCLCDRLE